MLKNGDERERGTGEERKVMIAMLIEELLLPVKRREGEGGGEHSDDAVNGNDVGEDRMATGIVMVGGYCRENRGKDDGAENGRRE